MTDLPILSPDEAAARGLLYTEDVMAASATAGRPIARRTIGVHQRDTAARLARGESLGPNALPPPVAQVAGRSVPATGWQRKIALSPAWDPEAISAWVAWRSANLPDRQPQPEAEAASG